MAAIVKRLNAKYETPETINRDWVLAYWGQTAHTPGSTSGTAPLTLI